MIILGKVYPKGKDGLLGVFKALPVASAHDTKPNGRTHARISARTHPSARMGASAGARTHTHTHIEKTPPCLKKRGLPFEKPQNPLRQLNSLEESEFVKCTVNLI